METYLSIEIPQVCVLGFGIYTLEDNIYKLSDDFIAKAFVSPKKTRIITQ